MANATPRAPADIEQMYLDVLGEITCSHGVYLPLNYCAVCAESSEPAIQAEMRDAVEHCACSPARKISDLMAEEADAGLIPVGDDLSPPDHLPGVPGVACDECDGGKRDVLWQHVCPKCHGTGRVTVCEACDGLGQFDQGLPCMTCHGTGR